MSLMSRLADAAETEAGETFTGSTLERATLALESIGGTTRDGISWADRIRLASQDIADAEAVLTGGPFDNAARNLTIASGLTSTLATPIERMILAIQEGFAVQFILDSYPALAAYSVRQLSSTATKCVRIRRSNDDAETDIGFVNGWIDVDAIIAFCGVNSAFVVTWYDQSGNGYDLPQTDPTRQPHLYNGSVMIPVNGKPSLFNTAGSNDGFVTTSFPVIAQPFTVFSITQNLQGAGDEYIWASAGNASMRYLDNGSITMFGGTESNSVTPFSGQRLMTSVYNGSSSKLRSDSALVPIGDVGAGSIGTTFHALNDGLGNAVDYGQELIFMAGDQTDNFAAIESNMLGAFQIIAPQPGLHALPSGLPYELIELIP